MATTQPTQPIKSLSVGQAIDLLQAEIKSKGGFTWNNIYQSLIQVGTVEVQALQGTLNGLLGKTGTLSPQDSQKVLDAIAASKKQNDAAAATKTKVIFFGVAAIVLGGSAYLIYKLMKK